MKNTNPTTITRRQKRNRWLLSLMIGLGYLFAVNLYIDSAKPEPSPVRDASTAPSTVSPPATALLPAQPMEVQETEHPFPLHQAIETNNHRRVAALLPQEKFLAQTDIKGHTALHVAVMRNNLETAAALVLAGSNPVAQNYQGKTPFFLHEVTRDYNRTDRFQQLLQGTVWHSEIMQVELSQRIAQAVFYIAAQASDRALMAQAISRGADINQPMTPDGRVVLHDTTSFELAEHLINLGADIEVQDDDGDTPLISAAKAGKSRVATALLNAGASVDTKNHRAKSALAMSIETGRDGYPKIVSALIAHGATIDQSHWIAAVSKRSAKVLRAIINQNVEFPPLADGGQEILKQAQARGGPAVLSLLQAHPTISEQLKTLQNEQAYEREEDFQQLASSFSPHLRIICGVLTILPVIVAFLMANLMRPSWRQWVASMIFGALAAYLLLLPVEIYQGITRLQFWGAPLSGIGIIIAGLVILIAAAIAASATTVIMAMRQIGKATKAHQRLTHRWGASIALVSLFAVLGLHHSEQIEILDRAYVSLAVPQAVSDKDATRQRTANIPSQQNIQADKVETWFENVRKQRVDQITSALANGQDPNVKDSKGYTALHITVFQRHTYEISARLLDAGADVNIPDPNGKLPLCIALRLDRPGRETATLISVMQLLLNHGASIRHPDCAPIHLAQNPATLDWLLANGAEIDGTMRYGNPGRSDFGRASALWHAVRDNNLSKTQALLRRGANPNAIESNKGFSVLQVALVSTRYKSAPTPETKAIIDLLLANGADPRWVAYDGTDLPTIDAHNLLSANRIDSTQSTAAHEKGESLRS
jgi:ankyrin repeat protein